MHRTILSTALIAILLLGLCTGSFFRDSAHARRLERFPGLKKSSSELTHRINRGRGHERVRVIVRPTQGWNSALDEVVESAGGTTTRRFTNLNYRVLTMSANAAMALSSRSDISYVTLDREVRTLGHLTSTTGADAVRHSATSTAGALDGSGIGIAVLDSGIDTNHQVFGSGSAGSRVVASQDFTGENRTDDPYGHGTHVASIAAGNGSFLAANMRVSRQTPTSSTYAS